MKRILVTALVPGLFLCACRMDPDNPENRRTKPVEQWLHLGEDVDANGFSTRNGNPAFGSAYVLERQYLIELDAESDYAIQEGTLDHRCGDDARISREFAMVGVDDNLVIARSFNGVRGFNRVPNRFVKLLALVFTDRSCQISVAEFSVVKAKLAPAADVSPKLDEFSDNRRLAAAPEALLNTSWIKSEESEGQQWVFEFAGDGTGIFGFRVDETTIRSGTIKLGTDSTMQSDHLVMEILTIADLPEGAPWQKDSVHYCRFRVTSVDAARSLELVCSEPNIKSLPDATLAVHTYHQLDPSSPELISMDSEP